MAAPDSVTPLMYPPVHDLKGHRLKSPLVIPHDLETSLTIVRFPIASIAQRIRATGFYPVCRRFESYWGHADHSRFSLRKPHLRTCTDHIMIALEPRDVHGR